jgi:hypothetical protein
MPPVGLGGSATGLSVTGSRREQVVDEKLASFAVRMLINIAHSQKVDNSRISICPLVGGAWGAVNQLMAGAGLYPTGVSSFGIPRCCDIPLNKPN